MCWNLASYSNHQRRKSRSMAYGAALDGRVNGKLVLQSTQVPILAEAPLTASRQKNVLPCRLPQYFSPHAWSGLLAYMHEGGWHELCRSEIARGCEQKNRGQGGKAQKNMGCEVSRPLLNTTLGFCLTVIRATKALSKKAHPQKFPWTILRRRILQHHRRNSRVRGTGERGWRNRCLGVDSPVKGRSAERYLLLSACEIVLMGRLNSK